MKKTLVYLASMLMAVGAYAQGTVIFQNSAAKIITNGVTGLPALAGTGFNAQLFLANNFTTQPGATDWASYQSGSSVVNLGPANGRISAGTITVPAAGGASGWFQVRAWEATLGNSWDTAYTTWQSGAGGTAVLGWSLPFLHTTGNPTGNPPTAASALTGMAGFTMTPVPEPSVIALGALGLAAILYRRRK